jgi:hypothetical protein
MTIYKNLQRDPRGGLLERLKGFLLRRPCGSYLKHYKGQEFRPCNLRLGHAGKHTDGEIYWGYGDDFFEGRK